MKRVAMGISAAVLLSAAIAWATSGSGTTSTPIGAPAVYAGFDVKRQSTGPDGWKIRIDAKDGVKVATQTITFAPGGYSGWHRHPGPVLISVVQGTMTFYESDCTSHVVSAGEGFVDVGEEAHLAKNEGGVPAMNVVTYLVPPAAPGLKIDEPAPPPNCPQP